ncbi:serine/threonine-protein kinase [Cronbergia sp. UHCC 0137]|uniref:serine/threonine protein kinase n=1 Tax=Cronbergia sp. UHCC 0137 TaxID=3110239 RepID=UPI002B1ECAFD|nr:serine/threonine-protein kinase [Cronbergia sp. UHCC 0137]MEA5618059.1 serine/threonine-protein kinase [Cronbergia sp. UHCC 0137]
MNTSPFASPTGQELLANRYQLKQLIGKGGMGEVFLAEDILLGGTQVAIKFLSQSVLDSSRQKNFTREALLSAALSKISIHIVWVYDYGLSESGKPFYVMEYLSGKSLKKLIPMPSDKFFNLTRQICLGLQCAHQGINIDNKIHPLIHRDIKPANIIVIPDPILGELAKILDFGIAKFINSSSVITTKGFHGTLPYCSPEQLEGGELDSRSDIYSLGVVMFEMLTGKKPWQPETDYFGAWYRVHQFEPPRAIADLAPHLKLPQQLNDLIMTCLAKKPEQRPQNIGEILQVLNKIQQSPQSLPANLQNPAISKLPQTIVKTFSQLVWPANKPIQEIVFPQLINTSNSSVVSLWLMLPQIEITNRSHSTRYNQFIFIAKPHPMLLWVTLLYNREHSPKWLPCYLDMQNPQNLSLVSTLAATEYYFLNFFTLEEPHNCVNILRSNINPVQQQNLQTWIKQSRQLPPTSQAVESKKLLKQQYKDIQSQMLQHLNSQNQISML